LPLKYCYGADGFRCRYLNVTCFRLRHIPQIVYSHPRTQEISSLLRTIFRNTYKKIMVRLKA
jgi:hypothetical protein